MTVITAVGVVGAGMLAAWVRLWTSRWLDRKRPDPSIPLAVLVVNAVASLLAGSLYGAWDRGLISEVALLIGLTGAASGLSTFGTLTVDTMKLARGGRLWAALLNLSSHLLVGCALATAGYLLVR